MATDKLKTGIPSFDVLVPGGLNAKDNFVLTGPVGSGKSIFGLQFLFYGVQDFGDNGIYVTTYRDPDDIIKDSAMFGWNFKPFIDAGKFVIIDARIFKNEEGFVKIDDSLYRGEDTPFSHITQLILSTANKISAKRIVIDSLSILKAQYSNVFYINQGLQGMFQALENNPATTIFITSKSDENDSLEWDLASGVILLDSVDSFGTRRRTVQVLKMIRSFHSEETFFMQLTDKGLKVIHPRIPSNRLTAF